MRCERVEVVNSVCFYTAKYCDSARYNGGHCSDGNDTGRDCR